MLGLSSKNHKTEIRRFKKIVERNAKAVRDEINKGNCTRAYEHLWGAENILGGLESHYVSIADSAQRRADTDVAMNARQSLLRARNLFGKKCVKWSPSD